MDERIAWGSRRMTQPGPQAKKHNDWISMDDKLCVGRGRNDERLGLGRGGKRTTTGSQYMIDLGWATDTESRSTKRMMAKQR